MDNGHEPATKADLTQLGQPLRSEMAEQTEQLCSDIRQMFAELKQTLRDGQTELLKVIYSFAHSIDMGLKGTDIDGFMLRQRLTAVESRVTEIERRINLPPETQ